MMVIAASLSVCTGEAESTSQQEITTSLTYPIVDTAQGTCYNNSELIDGPAEDEAFYEQNSQNYCESLSLSLS